MPRRGKKLPTSSCLFAPEYGSSRPQKEGGRGLFVVRSQKRRYICPAFFIHHKSILIWETNTGEAVPDTDVVRCPRPWITLSTAVGNEQTLFPECRSSYPVPQHLYFWHRPEGCRRAIRSISPCHGVGFHPTFSRHGIAQILSALALLIWLNEKVLFHWAPVWSSPSLSSSTTIPSLLTCPIAASSWPSGNLL